jgi:hypothetical protein
VAFQFNVHLYATLENVMIGKALIVVGGVTAIVIGTMPKGPAHYPVAKSVATVDKSAGMQAQRKKLIEKLMAHGIFLKTGVPGSLPRVWVGLPFYGLPFDEKQQFVSVVYAYYLDGSSEYDLLVVYDGYTNKKIGTFTLAGLSLN